MRNLVLIRIVVQVWSLAAPEVTEENKNDGGSVAFGNNAYTAAKYGNADRKIRDGSLVCAFNCEQGTIYYPDNSCWCVCKKNYGLYNDEKCKRAYWSRWSSWSKCLKSDWGGLQRRERICQMQDSGSPGDCDGRGSEARMCTAVKKEFRVRKNVNDLSDEELHDLLQAMTKFKKDKTKRGYRNIISWHGYPGRCPWNRNIRSHEDGHCSFHNHPLFQSWHRLITVQLELGLSRYLKNKTMGVPYWDWTEESTDIPHLIKNPEIYDPILKKLIKNPFNQNFIKTDKGVKKYNVRKPAYSGLLMSRYILRGTIRALLCRHYSKYDNQIYGIPHDQIHGCFCYKSGDDCKYSMTSTKYASWDPAFLLHHSAMDRILVIRKALEDEDGITDWTSNNIIGQWKQDLLLTARRLLGGSQLPRDITEAFDWPMSPFCNKSMNPESVTGNDGMWTMHNAFYNEQLFGYKYDNFNFGHDYKWEDLQRDYRRNVIKRTFWNDDYFVTKLGELTKANSLDLRSPGGCTVNYSNTQWNMTIIWA